MNILIQNGRVVDPASGLDVQQDVAIASGRIIHMGRVSPEFKPNRVIDATGLVVAPGLVDLCARLGEPGHEHEGMLESELKAAAAGGITSVVCSPDTDPVLDEPGLVEMLKRRARKLSYCRLFAQGALTKGLQGEALTEMSELTDAGCIAFGQADTPIVSLEVLLRAMRYAATFNYTVWLQPTHAQLGGGVAASGALATRLGLSGVPSIAETIALYSIFELAKASGVRLHISRVSSAAGVELVRQAKAQGLPVTADVSINSLHLTDADIKDFDAAYRVYPPLRQAADRQALRDALAEGVIDVLVSDHTPVDADLKVLPFAQAQPGAVGMELLLGLALRWAKEEKLSMADALARITCIPVKVLGKSLGSLAASAGQLTEGGVADLCLFDPDKEWKVDMAGMATQGKSTPFAGQTLTGQVQMTIVAGHIAYEHG
ncbi:Dihydroorotase [Saezia sanguinis]|uniref:Dihydroorotase n=1 Tax=Saezia sanguinis TaxID=1965230 RepID=A0A433SAF7_9BURK|nr:dihydroorotase [Saezia sanguinis]RUS65679.1 Dihydroorotase [Saezia sanguinis]